MNRRYTWWISTRISMHSCELIIYKCVPSFVALFNCSAGKWKATKGHQVNDLVRKASKVEENPIFRLISTQDWWPQLINGWKSCMNCLHGAPLNSLFPHWNDCGELDPKNSSNGPVRLHGRVGDEIMRKIQMQMLQRQTLDCPWQRLSLTVEISCSAGQAVYDRQIVACEKSPFSGETTAQNERTTSASLRMKSSSTRDVLNTTVDRTYQKLHGPPWLKPGNTKSSLSVILLEWVSMQMIQVATMPSSETFLHRVILKNQARVRCGNHQVWKPAKLSTPKISEHDVGRFALSAWHTSNPKLMSCLPSSSCMLRSQKLLLENDFLAKYSPHWWSNAIVGC